MRLRRLLVPGLAVLAVGSGYVAYAANADDPSYRTAVASVGDVEQTLALAGTIEPAGRADLAFATSGTVADVRVEAGNTVKAGQVLGTLDDTTLRKQVQQARAELAAAKAQLESDREAQASSVSTSSASSTTTTTATPVVYLRTATEEPTPEPDGELAALQQAVIDEQSVVSDSLAAAAEALAAQQEACTAETVAEQACADALIAVQTAQQQVSEDQTALQAAIDALAAYLQEAEQPDEPEQPEQPEQSQPPQVEQPSAPQEESQQPQADTPSVSAATLARDQAAIDQAEADLVSAKQELRMATVTAPFGGRIVEVDVAEGDAVASGTDVFVLVSRGTTTAEVGATSSQLQQLEVGQTARVTPTGSEKALDATVTSISSIPDDAGSYPVTVTVSGKGHDLATGLTAAVAVVTGQAKDVVTVPASAVSDGSVQVVEHGETARARVTTGVVGETAVEITDGLQDGDVVVLADLDREIPSSGDETGGFGGPGGMQMRFPGGDTLQPPSGFQPRGNG